MQMMSPKWWDRVGEAIGEYQAQNARNLPGAAYGIETVNEGRLVGSVGPGWRDDAICDVGSMTKPFVSAAALIALEESGILDIETPVHQLPGMEPYAEDAVRRQIRLRHLLQHTSGLPHVRRSADWAQTPCPEPSKQLPGCFHELDLGPTSNWIGAPGLTNERVYADGRCRPARAVDLEQVGLHIMRTYPVQAHPAPGSEYAYSTANYILVARIIEHCTGQSVNQFIKERLFVPLHMADSFFIATRTGDPEVDGRLDEGVTDDQRARIADFVLITADGLFPPEIAPGPGGSLNKMRSGWRFVNPDAGLFSTVGDLLNFLVMLRDGGTFLSRRVLSDRIVSLLIEDQGHGHTMGFGYRKRVTPYGQHGGTLEHLGFKMTYFWLDRSADNPLAGVFLSQRMPNFITNTNMSEGLRPIFKVFVPSVTANAFGAASNDIGQTAGSSASGV